MRDKGGAFLILFCDESTKKFLKIGSKNGNQMIVKLVNFLINSLNKFGRKFQIFQSYIDENCKYFY